MGNVFNIESEIFTKVKGEKFAVDTNVLYWTFYEKSTYSSEKRRKIYPNAVTNLKLHNTIYVSPLCLYELFVIIEKNEYKIYCAEHGKDENFKLKDYREIAQEREKVGKILEITYKNIRNFASILPQNIEKEGIGHLASSFAEDKLDVFDKTLAVFCRENDIKNIITDDRDYRTVVDELNVYTANRNYFRK